MPRLSCAARRLSAWLLIALMLLCPLQASAQSIPVVEIEIRGNQRVNQETIRTVMETRVGQEASAERLQRDRAAVEQLGYFRTVDVIPQRVGAGVRVVVVVQEYPVVQSLEITGSTIFPDDQLRSTVEGALFTSEVRVFNQNNWENALAALNKLYGDRGYQVRFIYNTDQAEFLDQGILRLEIHELRVGSLKLKWPARDIKDKDGNVIDSVEEHKTKNYVVLRELGLRQGALYNTEQLQRDYRALTNLGFFETINPSVRPLAESDQVEITWELAEKRTGQVSVGAGYSPRQRFIGRAEVADQNFQGKGRSVSLSAEIGTFGGDGRPSVELNFFEPWLTKDKTSLTVSLYDKLVWRFSRNLIRSPNDNRYFERRLGGQVNFGRPFQWPVNLGLRFDNVNTGELSRRFVDFPQQNGTVIAGNVTRIWNTRDYATNPTQGQFVRLSGELGHASLDDSNANDFDSSVFGKYIADWRKYIALRKLRATKEPEREQEAQKTPVLALRAMLGTITGDVPFFEQFFMGGAETLRGYLEDRFWGNTMYLGSVEYRRPLFQRIIGVVFVDVGDAFGSESVFRFSSRRLRTDFKQHSGPRPFASIGLGLRVATPIGPIRFDFGYGEEGGRSHFSIGHAF